MWFKNIRIYRFSERFDLSPDQLNDALAEFEFKPCGKLDPMTYGWTSPLGRNGSQFVHAANGYIMICAKREEKVLPASAVKEAMEEKAAEVAASEARPLGRTERQNLKEDILFSLMPRALAKASYDFAYIDTKEQLLVVNTSAASRAETLISALRQALDTLKVVPLLPIKPPREVLTHWLTEGNLPEDVVVGEECELSSIDEGRSIKFKHQDLWIEEVGAHIKSGLQVTKLVIGWKDNIECLVDDQFSFKRIKYGSQITEQAEDHNNDSAVDQFDVEFSIMTLELSAFIGAMVEAFGGVDVGGG